MFIRLLSNSDMAWDRYVAPFSYGLWLAVAIAACAISACLALINYGTERNQDLSLMAILFYIHACFCQQGQTQKSYLLPSYFLYIFNAVLKLISLFYQGKDFYILFRMFPSSSSLNTFYWTTLIWIFRPVYFTFSLHINFEDGQSSFLLPVIFKVWAFSS